MDVHTLLIQFSSIDQYNLFKGAKKNRHYLFTVSLTYAVFQLIVLCKCLLCQSASQDGAD